MLATSIADAWRESRRAGDLTVLSRRDVDLRDPEATRSAFSKAAPDMVIHTAAYVGGIADKLARRLPYLLDNIRIDSSVLGAVVDLGIVGYVYTGSAAAYPAQAPSPINERALFEGRLEHANEAYGLAKLTGITAVRYAAEERSRAYRAILPSNLYGPRDNFDPARSHLIASTIRKAHDARVAGRPTVEVWGDGTARREFTFAPDLAVWLVDSIDRVAEWPVVMNIGAGVDHSIREYYEYACDVVGYTGDLSFDTTKPSGVHQRLIDSSLASRHGWKPTTSITDGMTICYDSFLTRIATGELA